MAANSAPELISTTVSDDIVHVSSCSREQPLNANPVPELMFSTISDHTVDVSSCSWEQLV